ncbi:S24 family peptidase [Xanthobacter aminoxidans]|uniref:S24 family peptidase n=1 Tax=Xanthobacter aminoxidans TaxID=186280 RepID=UPI002022F408|nr:S24 family peptidase [Xanthobacter aminoxidans]MCL8385537.1 helix-turn-helix domain-containing protein [Xanthobacter aminoxidans]
MPMIARWVRDAIKSAGISGAELARRMNQRGFSVDRAAINKMMLEHATTKTKPRKVTAAELIAISEITNYPLPLEQQIGDRIKFAREAAGLTQEQLAAAIGSEGQQSSISEIERGRVQRPQKLYEIALATNTSMEWLLGDPNHSRQLRPLPGHRSLIQSFDPDTPDEQDGEFHPDTHGGVSTDRIYKPDVPGASPVIDTRAGAGPGSIGLPAIAPSGGVIYSEDAVIGEILLPGYLQQEISRAPAGRMHWVRVRGDSMEPTLQGGDHVAVDTTDTALGQGGMFVARNGDGEIIVKRLYRIPKSDPPQIEVRSDNATLEPPRVVDADWLTVIGRVVAKIGRIG